MTRYYYFHGNQYTKTRVEIKFLSKLLKYNDINTIYQAYYKSCL